MGRDAVTARLAQERKREEERPGQQHANPIHEALQRSPDTSNDPATVLALQRSVGNRAVQRLLEHRAGLSAPGHRSLARLQESHGAGGAGVVGDDREDDVEELDDEVEEVDEDLDDEAAQYVHDPKRNPHTLGQYLLPALAAADGKSPGKLAAEAKLKEAAEAKAKLEAEAKVKARLPGTS